ncbi:ankyrin repeat domain-containing protein [Phaeosphaeria sp. MPI-PUGE-AT-0046c]|nr:ankyrin repeat domain-containing protein [Phaeosphaeria sp. MPI-PUGE-AT-0046c]
MLDEKHDDAIREGSDNDQNIYCMGSIAGHNVVIACLPAGQIGNNPAATVATQMQAAFKGLRFGLMVGIGGGVPSAEADIRLGDVVVSQPRWTFGGVVQYDFGRRTPDGLERIGSLNSPPQILLSAVTATQAREIGGESTLFHHISTLERISAFQRRRAGLDLLFNAAYNHEHGATCDRCSVESRISRPERESGAEVTVHYGTIASGNQVIKDAAKRDRWQAYGAGTAAAYAKELLSVIPAADVMKTHRAGEAMDGVASQSSERCRQPRSPDQASCKRRKISISSSSENVYTESDQYLNWLDTTKLDEHHGFLWIKGNAGTGKSTLMKFALLNARKTMNGCTVLSFFFNARGEDMEKSTVGTYRSLLLQLLEHLPALQNSVFGPFSVSTLNFCADRQWDVELLKTLLDQAIRDLGDSAVVRGMIQFFEHMGDLAVSNGISFRVCFSSRHYPYITIRNGLELVLDGQDGHLQDITEYIESELKIGKNKTAQQIRDELQRKSSGIFMWVVLVVGILNKESDRGQAHNLQRKLREIPGDLHTLFRDILTRDTHNKDGLILCIQWVLFARQPLSPEQLYHAILSGVDLEAVTALDPEEITQDVIKRFILDSSKGLAEATKSKGQRVQFIHESVRDFLLKENGLGIVWPEYGNNFQGQSHDRLKQCCLDYISMDIATPLNLPDKLPKASSDEAAVLRESATQRYPFLQYAVRNVLYHADAAHGDVSQVDFLDSFPLPQWIKLDNLFEKHEIRRHTKHATLPGGYYDNALQAALTGGSKEIVALLLDKGANVNAQGGYYSSALYTASATGYTEVVMLLLDKGANVNAQGGHYGNALQAASTWGHKEIVMLLLDKGANVNAQGGHYGNGLQAASTWGHKEIVMLLLDKGANVNAQGGHYGNGLQAASHKGHHKIVALLQEHIKLQVSK